MVTRDPLLVRGEPLAARSRTSCDKLQDKLLAVLCCRCENGCADRKSLPGT